MGKDNNIPVLDQNNQFLSYTNPAKARILTRKGRAKVFCRKPYMLQLVGEAGEEDMTIKGSSKRSKLILNFTKYFKEEKEVYVQNLLDSQISLTFKSPGGDDYHLILPKTRKPYNLTLDIPFELIKISPDFRKIVNRNPPGLRLLEEEEYLAYYEKQADRNNSTFDEEMGKATDLKNRLQNKIEMPSERLQRAAEQQYEDRIEAAEAPVEISPQVIGMCVSAMKDAHPRILAGDFIEQMEMWEDNETLVVDDWEYIQTKGVYKSVKLFAGKMIDKLTGGDEDEDDL